MNPQKISDIWKALRKIYQMRPTIGIFSNFCRSYKQNKGIHAILEKVQQPVLHHGKKMRFIKKAPYRFFCNLLQWIYTSNGHVKLQKKSQLSQNKHEGMDSEQCVLIAKPRPQDWQLQPREARLIEPILWHNICFLQLRWDQQLR